ncbi:pilus assembly protein TadG-related protein [Streptomyces sp. NBC_00690]|uniref:pilus assembly protein TadG-related protein n=1 Tax=Streptomyces sp. NBC_00690 TaxID=2975808 RepID=UPI002E2ADE58|nr:pilus assembly protein TadG-related protein [Streptomyces sp. NBC_00690]
MPPRDGDAGQAAPLYVAVVVGILALALAFFAVGQAGATRNGAQSGADAAALAAAMDSRDQFGVELAGRLSDADFLEQLFDGEIFGDPGDGCPAAHAFAESNGTVVVPGSCQALGGDRWGYTVTVRTQEPVGDTILPGTESETAKATATAIVTPRCTFEAPDEEPPPDSGEGEEAEPTPPTPSTSDEPILAGVFFCDGEEFPLDPDSPDPLPDMSELFTVRLAED